MRWLPLLALALAGCPKKSPNQWASESVRQWAPAPQLVEYTRVNVAGPFNLPNVEMRDEWYGPTIDGDRLLYDIHTYDVSEAIPVLKEKVRHFYGPEGYGYIGTIDADGSLEIWDPPELVLPAEAVVGATWEGTHTKGDVTSVRSCEILDSEYCAGGIVSVCDSDRGGGRIILRDHFCPDIGWSGFEAMVVAGDKPPVRMWTEHVVRDGVALPESDAP